MEKSHTCAQNLGRQERKYGNLRARPQPSHGRGRGPVRGASRAARGGRSPEHRRGRDQPGLGTPQGRSRGSRLRGGSSLRSGFLLSATVLTRFLGPPSDIYLTSQFSLSGPAGGVEAGRGEAGGEGSHRGTVFPPHRPRLSGSRVGPILVPPDRGGQPTPWLPGILLVHSPRFGDRKPGRSHLSKVLE